MPRRPALRLAVAALTLAPVLTTGLITPQASAATPPPVVRQMEHLDRGVVAVKVADGVYLSWRFLGDEPDDVAFRIHRDGQLVATVTDSTNWTDPAGTATSSYEVEAVAGDGPLPRSAPVRPLANQAMDIPLQRPAPAVVPVAQTFETTVSGKQFEPVDMNLLRRIRDAHAAPAGLTEGEFAQLIAPLPAYLQEPGWAPRSPFATEAMKVEGDRYRISDGLFAELDETFRRYVDKLDRGPRLDYVRNPDGSLATATSAYTPAEAVPGDLDGDGSYELVVKWNPDNAKDSSQYGYTAPTIIDAYELDGRLLWRVDMGWNIRAGAHDTQLVVQDFDGDGRAELILKTANGTASGGVDAAGKFEVRDVVGDAEATSERMAGYVAGGDVDTLERNWDALNTYAVSWILPGGNTPPEQNVRQWGKVYTYGPIGTSEEYLTAFDGVTGRIIDSTGYAFPYGDPNWGVAPVDHRGANFEAAVADSETEPGGQVSLDPKDIPDPYWSDPATRWGYYPWGDHQGNRANRFLGGVAYLDGQRPSAIMARGYYARSTVAAYTLEDGKLRLGATFDSAALPDPDLGEERGVHSMMSADVDLDGRDEIVYGAMILDDDLTVKTVAGTWFPFPVPAPDVDLTAAMHAPDADDRFAHLVHGDAFHVGDFDPARPGPEVFIVQEQPADLHTVDRNGAEGLGYRPGAAVYDPVTGEVRAGVYTGGDNEKGVAENIDPNSPGAEYWTHGYVYSAVTGERLYATDIPMNFLVYWDGDLTRELLDAGTVSKPNTTYTERPASVGGTALFTAEGVGFNRDGGRNSPLLSADLLGDWREEIVWKVGDDRLRLYTTTIPTAHKLRTLMHDPQYRNQVASQSTVYNMAPHPGFFLDPDTAAHPLPGRRDDIDVSPKG
ncbi:hypothetical protein [Pseudonocardia xinjiangensis]|uniref:Rhamnogalacturonan I lyase beta-sheet domain-containing protein n=1 Tax=Pseudonocardia xinjiangensis TaxID=75289 RepID=A0ABX1RA01_9PSEU|nr:hypothetical protein [Pseudonocardia xinjiangensis]NMH77218.1 hypothetical protein [Pseudonocardia xinjiangensis]